MDALILAAGLGSRLGKYLEGNPKPMLRIGEKPLLEINIDKLINIGIHQIYINVHFNPHVITDFISETQKYKNKVQVIYEEKLLGTAGTVKHVVNSYNPKDLLVMHGDNYFQDNLVVLVNEYSKREEKFIGVVGTFITSQPENCGILQIKDGLIEKIFEKSNENYGNIANSATYILDKTALDKIKVLGENQNDLSINFIPLIIQQLKPVPFKGIFIDIGTPENLAKARSHAETN